MQRTQFRAKSAKNDLSPRIFQNITFFYGKWREYIPINKEQTFSFILV